MSNGRLTGLLGICRKAGRIKLGFDPVAESLGNDAKLLIFTADISPKTRERMQKKAEGLNIPSITLTNTTDDMLKAVGKRAAVMAVTDSGLAERAAELHREAQSRQTENHDEEDTDL